MIGTSDGQQFKDSMAATMALGASEKPAGALIEGARYPGSPQPLGRPQSQYDKDAREAFENFESLHGPQKLDEGDARDPSKNPKKEDGLGGWIDPDSFLSKKGIDMPKSDMGMSRGDHQGDLIDRQPVFGNPTATKQNINLDPRVSAVLSQPHIAEAIQNPKIDRSHEVPYVAGASSKPDDYTTHVDKSVPSSVTISGKTFDPAIPLNIHEQVERSVMEELKKSGMKDDKAYEIAHHEFAEPAEDAWYKHHGIDVADVNKWWKGIDQKTEKDKGDFPPNLYKAPYPHDKVEGVKHEPSNVNQEWAMNVKLPANDNLPAHNPMRQMDEISERLKLLQGQAKGKGQVLTIPTK